MGSFTPLSLLLWSALAATGAALGAYLGARRPALADHTLGWANATAAGLMLGIGYAVLTAGLELAPFAGTAGGAVGVVVMYALRHAPMRPRDGEAPHDAAARRVSLASALHSGAEGVAIGAAAALGSAFAAFLLVTFALHNVGEGAVLGSALAGAERASGRAAIVAFIARIGQPALAAFTLAVLLAMPALLPWALGIAFGALVYLILAELLPASYHQTGRTSIALVVSLAAGIVALLGGGVAR